MRRCDDRARYRSAVAPAVRADPLRTVCYVGERIRRARRERERTAAAVRRLRGTRGGEAIAELEDRKPDLRIINLETSVTRHSEPEPKGINYRMSPDNFVASGRPGSIVARSPTITFSIGAKLACWTRSPQSKRRVSQPQARGGM